MIRRHPTAITVTTEDIFRYDDQKTQEEALKAEKQKENSSYEPPKESDKRSKEERLGIRS